MSDPTITQPGASDRIAARYATLTARAQGLRTRSGAGDHSRWLAPVGAILTSLGFALVILGWMGSSRTVLVFEQLPYLISGGLLGLGFVIAGAFAFFAHWLTLVLQEARRDRQQSERMAASLERIEALLSARAADEGD